MRASAVPDLLRIVLPVVVGLAVLSPFALGQLERDADAARRRTVTGRVFLPDGSPASGAAVVTSAGGHALTGADGSFALAVELPLDAESLEVTAIADEGAGSGDLVASARIVPAALAPTTTVGTLALTLSPSCHPRWLSTFGSKQGLSNDVNALAVFDDGSGPALYASGHFTSAGGHAVDQIAKWDGSRWTALGTGLLDGSTNGLYSANVLCAYDDGSGSVLVAGGFFDRVGGSTVNSIAQWDGADWAPLGSGLTRLTGRANVHALTVYDDGSGPALVAGGSFQTAGGVAASNIAKWDGTSWSALGSGINGEGVKALAGYDDGSGPALYAAGYFTTAGGVAASNIAKWDGTSWSSLGSGMNNSALALAVHDDGSGPSLFAGGGFTSADGVAVSGVARWDGSSWSALGPRSTNVIAALTVYDDGSGPALYAGSFLFGAGQVEKWNGASWSVIGSTNDDVYELVVYDDGSGPALHAGGGFTSVGGVQANRLAKWNGASWSAPGYEPSFDSHIEALAVHDDGSGQALFAAGFFSVADGVSASRIARWNGSTWSALGSGISGGAGFPVVYALTVFDDGGGPALYAGGEFGIAGGVAAKKVAKWDGSSWSALGAGPGGAGGRVLALAGFDDGGGPALYAGGNHSTPGYIARWDGSTWSALGSGLSNDVHALAVFDDGGGPALYAGGLFTTAGGLPASRIARWDGSTWSALGSGLNGDVEALLSFDDGVGSALYAGGAFTSAGGVTAYRIARWDGSSWTNLGSGLGPSVLALFVHDDGGGAALYAGGSMGKRVAKWDRVSWIAMGFGMENPVQALASFDHGEGPALFAGGRFHASPAGDSFLARWACRVETKAEKRKL